MAKKYCTFWIPTTCHDELKVLNHIPNKLSDDISDKVGNCHHVSVEIVLNDEKNKDITITSTPESNENKTRTIILKYIQSSQNGLIEYFFELDNRNSENKFIYEALPNAIYHQIKGFFHNHEYHSKNGDSILKAYIHDEAIDIQDKDNKALIHYLKQFERKFIAYRDLIQEEYKFIEEKNNESLSEIILNLNRRHKQLDELCNNALGEAIYYNSLLHSWYNSSCKYDYSEQVGNSINFEEYKKRHRTALNTKNALDIISLLQGKNRMLLIHNNTKLALISPSILQENINEVNKITTETQTLVGKVDESLVKSDKLAKYIAGFTVIFTIVSIALGFLSLKSDPKLNSIETNQSEIVMKMDSILSGNYRNASIEISDQIDEQ